MTLASLVPGAVPDNGLDTSHVGVYGNNSISFNGNRTQYNNWEIDGGNNTDEGSAGTFNTYPNLDTIAEFRISTSNYGADMGKHAGATIEVATKSGTRQFHGDAFEYVRNDVLDARNYFNDTRFPQSALRLNQFGATFGGPIIKNRTFYFLNYEGFRHAMADTTSSSAALRLGSKSPSTRCGCEMTRLPQSCTGSWRGSSLDRC